MLVWMEWFFDITVVASVLPRKETKALDGLQLPQAY